MSRSSGPGLLSDRDLSVLRAVADGRCMAAPGGSLTVDGVPCCDQFAVARLMDVGLVVVEAPPGRAQLTDFGRSLLRTA